MSDWKPCMGCKWYKKESMYTWYYLGPNVGVIPSECRHPTNIFERNSVLSPMMKNADSDCVDKAEIEGNKEKQEIRKLEGVFFSASEMKEKEKKHE